MTYLASVKRAITIIILLSMVLHCASRLGVLTYLYEQRHHIAFNAGLIAEIPIALCNSDYHFQKELTIDDQQEDDSLPVTVGQAHEIILYLQETKVHLTASLLFMKDDAFTLFVESEYPPPPTSIFHPPC